MTNKNELHKRIIEAFANAPKIVFNALIDKTDDKDDKDTIRRIAKALNVDLGGKE